MNSENQVWKTHHNHSDNTDKDNDDNDTNDDGDDTADDTAVHVTLPVSAAVQMASLTYKPKSHRTR